LAATLNNLLVQTTAPVQTPVQQTRIAPEPSRRVIQPSAAPAPAPVSPRPAGLGGFSMQKPVAMGRGRKGTRMHFEAKTPIQQEIGNAVAANDDYAIRMACLIVDAANQSNQNKDHAIIPRSLWASLDEYGEPSAPLHFTAIRKFSKGEAGTGLKYLRTRMAVNQHGQMFDRVQDSREKRESVANLKEAVQRNLAWIEYVYENYEPIYRYYADQGLYEHGGDPVFYHLNENGEIV